MLSKLQKQVLSFIVFLLFITNYGCVGTCHSKFHYDETYRLNIPVKDATCYDAAVLLGVDVSRAKEIAKKAIAGLDAKIQEATDTCIKAQRSRHIGIFVGSGGEVLMVKIDKVDEMNTFITATTKGGFFGPIGSKPWSCKLIDEMIRLASSGN